MDPRSGGIEMEADMSGRRGTETRRLSRQILLRLDPAMHAAIDQAAAAADLSAAAWVRRQLVDVLDADPAAARPTARRSQDVPAEDLRVLAALTDAVARLNASVSAVRQVAVERGIDHAPIDRMLAGLGACRRELTAIVLRLKRRPR